MSNNFANAVAVQSDDKIVVAGHANVNINAGTSDFSLVRYNADGALDSPAQPLEMALEHVVGGSELHGLGRAFFADRAGDKNERNVRQYLHGHPQRGHAVEPRNREI